MKGHASSSDHNRFSASTISPNYPKRLLQVAIVVALTGLSTACGGEKTEADYLNSAKKYLENGDIKAATIELKNTIQQNPSNSEARYLLGKLYLSDQQGALAEKEFNRAAESGYPKEQLVDELALAYYYQYKFDDLLTSTIQQQSLTPEEKGQVLFLRGLANLALQRKQDAQADFNESAAASVGSAYSQLATAYLSAIEDKLDEATLITLKVLETNSDLVEANLLAGKLFFGQKDIEKALQYQTKAIAKEPNRLQLYIDMARYQAAAKNIEEASKNIDIVLKAAPNHLPSNLIKASLEMSNKNWESAREHADRALAVSEVNKQAKLISGMANFYLENWEISREKLKAVVPFLGDQHMAKRMLAYAEFKLGYAQSADDILNSMGSTDKQDSALLSEFGTQLVQQGNIDDAVKLYGKAAQVNPEDNTIKTRLGFLKLQQNDLEGVTDLESVIADDNEAVWARSGLVRFHVMQKNFAEAEKVARELISAKPEAVDGYLLTASVLLAQQKNDEALSLIDKGLSQSKDDARLLIEKAKVLSILDKTDAAQAVLENALSAQPHEKNLLMANYRLGKTLTERQPALEKLKVSAEANPNDDSYKLLYSLALMDQRNPDEAYKQLLNVKPEGSYFGRAQLAAGNIAANGNKLEEALKHFDAVIKADKTMKAAYQAKILAQTKLGKTEDALTTMEQALALFPGDQNLQLKEIELLLAQKQLNQADKRAKRFVVAHGESPILETILGRYQMVNKKYSEAITHLAKAHKLNPASFTAINLAQVQNMAGNKADASNTIKEWLKTHEDDQAARMYLANLQLNADHTAAIQSYRALLEKNPDNLVALNNIAWALGEQGNISEALIYAEKAHRLKAVPPVMDTYGYLLFQNGEHEKAFPLLKQAYEESNGEPSITYHYALALQQSGRLAEAKALFEKAVAQDFPEKSKAMEMLNTF